MNILIVGSGAREHAIAKALHRSLQNPTIFCCGTTRNPGIEALTANYYVGDICAIEDIVEQGLQWKIDLAIIGPEAPLEKGLADALWHAAIPTVGPQQQLAKLETSKTFTRDLQKKYHIPGALDYRVFKSLVGVQEYLHYLGEHHYVIKADGLMGGKGVKVAGDHLHSFAEALLFCEELIAQGCAFVIEEKLIGQEFSAMCFCDGNQLVSMPLVQDHKRAYVGDLGPNTGGMGTYSHADHLLPFLTAADANQAQLINKNMLAALTAEFNLPYVGILYGSFIATQKGVQLIEYNARFGDPEAMNVLAILESDFVTICQAMVNGTLTCEQVVFSNLATVCKYAVPHGYPDSPVKNVEISIDLFENQDQLYLSAVNIEKGKLLATGSRTAAVVGVANTISAAEQLAEREINKIQGPLFHREDIGTEALIKQKVLQMKQLREPELIT